MVIRDDDRKPALLRISHLFYRRYSIVAGYDSINTIRYGGIYKSFIYSVSIMHSMWNVVIHHGAVISAASVQRRPCSPKYPSMLAFCSSANIEGILLSDLLDPIAVFSVNGKAPEAKQ